MSERIERIEALLESADPPAEELVRELLEMYGEGLARVMALAGEAVAAKLADDDLVGPLLVLHDLHPLDLRARVTAALPQGASLVEVGEGLVRLRVGASGCRSSAVATAERAVRAAAPEVERVEVEADTRPVIPVDTLTVRRGAQA
ncbi:hypothetical protein [Spongiactinospora sp. TRM90649]|uniref:hypothetical protein n=1 Tax=Spongiactinospora sp. TRM90649 TaxID=3031114 RepID=UPI0023F78FC7|nr:hypothetical protein [Spongiactinospora sp. TRM90649]MDF5751750.1 hypothetical protein [Spongiactinospora sp. TRM90649]